VSDAEDPIPPSDLPTRFAAGVLMIGVALAATLFGGWLFRALVVVAAAVMIVEWSEMKAIGRHWAYGAAALLVVALLAGIEYYFPNAAPALDDESVLIIDGEDFLMALWGLGGLALWSLIFFPLIDTKSVPLIALSLSGMLLLQGAYLGPQPAVFSELFPTEVRYSGASLSLTLATIFGGAPAPFIATALFGLTGSSWPVTAYATVIAVVSWLCVLGLDETYRRDLSSAPTRPAGAGSDSHH